MTGHGKMVICPKCKKEVNSIRMSSLYKCCFTCAAGMMPKTKPVDNPAPVVPAKEPEKIYYTKNTAAVVCLSLVGIDLSSKGYRLFTAVSDTYRFQLIAEKEDKITRVKVISGVASTKALRWLEKKEYDCIAIVTPDGNITYKPEILG